MTQWKDVPDDFVVPGFPKGVDLPDQMRAFWLGRIQGHHETVGELECLLKLARMTRSRSILNARLMTNVTLEEIASVVDVSATMVDKYEAEALRRARGE